MVKLNKEDFLLEVLQLNEKVIRRADEEEEKEEEEEE
jgi:hypothetical protein